MPLSSVMGRDTHGQLLWPVHTSPAHRGGAEGKKGREKREGKGLLKFVIVIMITIIMPKIESLLCARFCSESRWLSFSSLP